MVSERDFLQSQLDMALKRLPIARHNANDKSKDSGGMGTSLLTMCLRSLGVLEYLVNHNIKKYQHCLQESVNLKMSLVPRYDAGEPISESYMSILLYKKLFDALASQDMALAVRTAHAVGGREVIEKQHDHPFDLAIGYALKALVLESGDMLARVQFFKHRSLSVKGDKNFQGYANVMEAIATHDQTALDNGFPQLINEHKRESKSGIFDHTDDEDLSIWGIGLANLAISRGLTVSIDDPLLPQDLLIKA